MGWSDKYLYADGSDTPTGVMSLPMYWRAPESSVHQLPIPAGYEGGQAYHISGNGTYIVGDLYPEEGSGLKPCTGVWKKTGDSWSVQALPVPDELLALSNTPTPRISGDGSMVTTTGVRESDEAFVAMIWQKATGWNTSEEFLLQQGADLAGHTIMDLNVSDDGMKFTGVLANPDGSESAYVFYKTTGWAYSNTFGSTYRFDSHNSYSLALGYIYETAGPWIYFYRNGWGWMCYVRQATDTSHYMYSPEWQWVHYDPAFGGWFQSSAHDWGWFNFHSRKTFTPGY